MTRQATLVAPGAGLMRSLYAFGRLLLRPIWFLGAVYLLALIAGMPWMLAPDTAFATFRAGVLSPAAQNAMWRDTLLVPFGFGCAAALAVAGLMVQPFARMLPAIQTLILRGTMALGVVVAVAIPHARIEGFTIGVTAFGVAFVAYCTWLIPLDRAVSKHVGFVIWGAGLLLLIDPGLITAPTMAHPGPMALVALLCATTVLVRGLSPVPSVRRTSAGQDWADHLAREEQRGRWLKKLFTPSASLNRPWVHALADDRLVDRLRAVLYEATGSRRRGWLGRSFIHSAVLAAIVSVIPIGVQFLVFLIAQMLAMGPTPLSGGFQYPISRKQRAQTEFWSSFARSAFYCASPALLVPILYPALAPVRTRIGYTPPMPDVSLASIWLTVGVAFAFAPIPQWAWIQGLTVLPGQPTSSRRSGQSGAGPLGSRWIVLFLALVCAMLLARLVIRIGEVPGAVVVGTLIVAIQTGYWIALRRDTARSDFA